MRSDRSPRPTGSQPANSGAEFILRRARFVLRNVRPAYNFDRCVGRDISRGGGCARLGILANSTSRNFGRRRFVVERAAGLEGRWTANSRCVHFWTYAVVDPA